MVKGTAVQGDREKIAGVFIPEANLFFTIEPGMSLDQIVQLLGPLSASTVLEIQNALGQLQNNHHPN